MPTYQYACTACGHQLEAVQSFADEPLTECPSCEGRLRKLFSGIGVVFKGSGFYRTDSRNASSSSNGSGNGNGSGSGTKSDAKPAKDSKPATDSKPVTTSTSSSTSTPAS